MARNPDYPVPALEKGLDILEALAAANVPQSLAELAAILRRSSSELFRMLNCLERRGYLIRDEASGKFGLSLKLFALAHAHTPTEKLREAARLPMRQLAAAFRESCHLSVLEGGRLMVIAQQESPEPVRISIEQGGVFDATRTASGRLLLAHLSAAECAAHVARKERNRKSLTELERTLSAIRRSGISTAESESVDGVRDLAVLVGQPRSGIVAALAVTRLTRRGARQDEAALLDGMRAAATTITEALGLGG